MTREAAARLLLFLAQGCSALSRVLLYAAAGICDLPALARLSASRWDRTADFKERRILDAGLIELEERALGHMPVRGRIGIIGCGGGRDLLAWARRGCAVDGVDISPSAVDCARKELASAGLDGNVYRADAADFSFPGESYDAFVFSWFTYAYIPGCARRVRALRGAGRKLSENGRVVLTFNLRAREDPSKAFRLARAVARATGNPSPLEPGDAVGDHFVYEHSFTRAEIESEAAAAGFGLADWQVGNACLGADCLAVLRPLRSLADKAQNPAGGQQA